MLACVFWSLLVPFPVPYRWYQIKQGVSLFWFAVFRNVKCLVRWICSPALPRLSGKLLQKNSGSIQLSWAWSLRQMWVLSFQTPAEGESVLKNTLLQMLVTEHFYSEKQKKRGIRQTRSKFYWFTESNQLKYCLCIVGVLVVVVHSSMRVR